MQHLTTLIFNYLLKQIVLQVSRYFYSFAMLEKAIGRNISRVLIINNAVQKELDHRDIPIQDKYPYKVFAQYCSRYKSFKDKDAISRTRTIISLFWDSIKEKSCPRINLSLGKPSWWGFEIYIYSWYIELQKLSIYSLNSHWTHWLTLGLLK